MRSVNTAIHPSGTPRRRGRRAVLGLSAAAAIAVAASSCSSDDDDPSDSSEAPAATSVDSAAPGTEPAGTAPSGTGDGGEPLLATVDPDRCALNQDAGTITYL